MIKYINNANPNAVMGIIKTKEVKKMNLEEEIVKMRLEKTEVDITSYDLPHNFWLIKILPITDAILSLKPLV